MRILFRDHEKSGHLRYIEADYAEINEAQPDYAQLGSYELYMESLDWSLSAFFNSLETAEQLLQKALLEGYIDLTAYPTLFEDAPQDETGRHCSMEDCMDCDNTNCIYNPRHDN